MNNVSLIGRLTKNPEIRYTKQKNTTIADFTLAVSKNYRDVTTGEYGADFIKILAYGKTADFVKNYVVKGQQIGLTGRISTGNFTDKNGIKHYTTEVVADHIYFADSKKNVTSSNISDFKNNSQAPINFNEFEKNLEGDDLPF